MDNSKLSSSAFFDGIFSSSLENLVVKSLYCFDGKTVVSLLLFNKIRVMFTIDGTNSNIVLKTVYGALQGFSLHSSLHEMVNYLHDVFNISHFTIDLDYEKD